MQTASTASNAMAAPAVQPKEDENAPCVFPDHRHACCELADRLPGSRAPASSGKRDDGLDAAFERLVELRRSVPLCAAHTRELRDIIKEVLAIGGGMSRLGSLGLTAPRPLARALMPPNLASMSPRILVRHVESVMAHLQYNYTNVNYFSVRKDRPLSQIMDTARAILREQLPIKCVEAVFLSLYLTSAHRGIARIPVAFKTRLVTRGKPMEGDGASDNARRSEAAVPEYRHIILVLHHKLTNTYGALGTSRRAELACKDIVYHSLGDLLTEYRNSYARWHHRVVQITLGLPVPHTASMPVASGVNNTYQYRGGLCPRVPVCWRYCRLDVCDGHGTEAADAVGEGGATETASVSPRGQGVDEDVDGQEGHRCDAEDDEILDAEAEGENEDDRDGGEIGDGAEVTYDEDYWDKFVRGGADNFMANSNRLLAGWTSAFGNVYLANHDTSTGAKGKVERVGMRVLTVIDRAGERRYGEKRDAATRYGAGAADVAEEHDMLTRFGRARADDAASRVADAASVAAAKKPWASLGGECTRKPWLGVTEHEKLSRRRSLSSVYLPGPRKRPPFHHNSSDGGEKFVASPTERNIRSSHASVRYHVDRKSAPSFLSV